MLYVAASSFFEVEPGFDSEGFIHYQNGLNNETLNELVDKVKGSEP